MVDVTNRETATFETAPKTATPPASERPSVHIVLLAAIVLLTAIAHVEVMSAGSLRGYTPSLVVAIRNLAFFVPIVGAIPLTTAVVGAVLLHRELQADCAVQSPP